VAFEGDGATPVRILVGGIPSAATTLTLECPGIVVAQRVLEVRLDPVDAGPDRHTGQIGDTPEAIQKA
jgi:hypothetical protein